MLTAEAAVKRLNGRTAASSQPSPQPALQHCTLAQSGSKQTGIQILHKRFQNNVKKKPQKNRQCKETVFLVPHGRKPTHKVLARISEIVCIHEISWTSGLWLGIAGSKCWRSSTLWEATLPLILSGFLPKHPCLASKSPERPRKASQHQLSVH